MKPPMSVSSLMLFCGDPHGQFEQVLRAAYELKPMAIVLLGDMQAQQPLHEELAAIRDTVWFIHGNHDTDSDGDFQNLFASELSDRNLHGRVITMPDGTRIAGLGGVFRQSVWYPPALPGFDSAAQHTRHTPRQDRWRSGPARRHWSSIYPDDFEHLLAQRADILVTHEAPSCHPHGHGVIDDLARALGVRTAFHGHHHDSLDYRSSWNSLGFQAFGVGLRGVVDQDGNVVVPGELDATGQAERWYEFWKPRA